MGFDRGLLRFHAGGLAKALTRVAALRCHDLPDRYFDVAAIKPDMRLLRLAPAPVEQQGAGRNGGRMFCLSGDGRESDALGR